MRYKVTFKVDETSVGHFSIFIYHKGHFEKFLAVLVII